MTAIHSLRKWRVTKTFSLFFFLFEHIRSFFGFLQRIVFFFVADLLSSSERTQRNYGGFLDFPSPRISSLAKEALRGGDDALPKTPEGLFFYVAATTKMSTLSKLSSLQSFLFLCPIGEAISDLFFSDSPQNKRFPPLP